MPAQPSTCPRCGRPLPNDGSPCPLCLLQLALGETHASGGPTSTPAPANDLPPPIGPYRPVAVLGQGGMGTVYLAEQVEPLRRRVALKVIRAGQSDADVLSRFETERQALARLNHPGIARVLDAGATSDGSPFFVMEYVAGEPITAYCDRRSLPTTERIALFRDVCAAVQHAHQRGILHRDLKPSNILVEEVDGVPRPRVIDFGLAKVLDQRLTERALFTERGQIVGTPEYMSPEQAAGEAFDVDTTTDVYSLGVVLYELLTGALPIDPVRLREAGWLGMMKLLREEEPKKPSTQVSSFSDETASAVAGQRRTAPRSLRRALEGDLDWIVLRALDKERFRRYPNVSDLAADLGRHLRSEPVVAGPPSRAYRLRKFVRRHRVGVAAATALAVAVLAGLAVTSLLLVRVRRSDERHRALVVRFAVERGIQLLDAQRAIEALPWLVGAWRADAGDDQLVAAHRIRVAEALARAPALVAVWFHDRNVRAAAFAPAGQLIATAGEDGRVELRRVADGSAACPPFRHDGGVLAVAFSPDGSRLASGSRDGTARLWDLGSCSAVGVPLAHGGAVRGLVFAPDGSELLTASADGAARVFQVASGRQRLELHAGAMLQAARFSPDAARIATAGADGRALLWDAEFGAHIGQEMLHTAAVLALEFSPDGSLLASASDDRTARLWDARTGEPHSIPLVHHRAVDQLAFDRSGRRLVTASLDSSVGIWNTADGAAIGTPLAQENAAIAVDLDPRDRLAVAAWGSGVRLWDLAPEGAKLTQVLPHAGAQVVRFDPRGEHLVSGSEDGSVKLWSLQMPARPARRRLEAGVALDVSFSPDGRWLGVASASPPPAHTGEALVLDRATGERVGLAVPHARSVASVRFSPDGTLAASAGSDGVAKVWRVREAEPFAPPLVGSGPLASALFGRDGRSLLTAGGTLERDRGEARLWTLPEGTDRFPPLAHSAFVHRAIFSPDGERIATASADGLVQLWDATSGRALLATPIRQPGEVSALAFSPDGEWLAAGGELHDVRLWNCRTGDPAGSALPHGGPVFDLAFSPDGDLLATASVDGRARLWEVATGRLHAAPLEHRDLVRSVRFSPDGRWLITASADGAARIWDVRTGLAVTPRLTMRGEVIVALFAPDGSDYAYAGTEGVVVDRLAPVDDPLAALERRSERLSGQRFEPTQGVVAITGDELRRSAAAVEPPAATTADGPPNR